MASLTLKEEGGGEKGLIKGMIMTEGALPMANRPQTRGRSSGPSMRNTTQRGQSRGQNQNTNQSPNQHPPHGRLEPEEEEFDSFDNIMPN